MVASLVEWWVELPIWLGAPLVLVVLGGAADAAIFVVMKATGRWKPDD